MIPHGKVSRAEVARYLRDLELMFRPPDPENETAPPLGEGKAGEGKSKSSGDLDSNLRSESSQLHDALNLLADSAIAADDAISRNDAEGLAVAISALTLNAGNVQALGLAWGVQ